MVNEDRAYNMSEDVLVVDFPPSLANLARERSIERIVKHNGHLVIATVDSDWDENGNFIGDYSNLFKIAKKYVLTFNPDNLPTEEYKEAFLKGELPWQVG